MRASIDRSILEPYVAAGLSTRRIARKLGVSQNKIWRNCKLHGLSIRKQGAGVCVVCRERKSRAKAQFCSNACPQAHAAARRHASIQASGTAAGFTNRVAKAFVAERDGWVCSVCRNTQWQGRAIPLVLDHVNGHPEDGTLSNLRLVCGNCDMQLPTYKSRNRGNGRAWRRQRYRDGKSY